MAAEIKATDSTPSIRENFSIFSLPPVEAGIDKKYFINHRPVSQLTDASSPYEFVFGASSADMLDLKNSTLHLKVKLTESDGTVIGKDDQVSPANLLLHSLWEKVDVRFGGQLMTHTLGDYAYTSYLKTLKCLGSDKNHLESVGFALDSLHMDSSGKVKVVADDKTEQTFYNEGAYTRREWLSNGKTFQLEGPLLVDCFDTDRYLLNNTEVGLTLYRTRPNFHIRATNNDKEYKVDILDIFFKACYVKPTPGVLLGINKALEAKHKAIYPYTKTEVRSFTIPAGFLDVNLDDVFAQRVPDEVIVAMVSDTAKNGLYSKNPYNFRNYDLREIGMSVDGAYVPSQPLKLNFTENGQNFVEAYRDFISCMTTSGSDIPIDLANYRNG